MVAPVFSALFLTLPRRRLGARASTLTILAVLLDLSVSFAVAQEAKAIPGWGCQWQYLQYLRDRQEALDAASRGRFRPT